MLAIVIPYYKLTFFEATLQSLATQTNQRFKVYIGDDASPEDPSILLEKYKQQFDFVYHRFESNLGGTSLTQQWERCIALSGNEEWIMILGDDDVLGENVVELFYSNIDAVKKEEISVIRYATIKINELGYPISEIYLHKKIEKSTDFLFRKSRSSLSEYVFLKQRMIEIGFVNFPLAWFSDVLAVLEFSDFKNVYSLNEGIVCVRVSTLSISGSKFFLKKKKKAHFDFYYYLLSNKLSFFSKAQQEELLFRISKCYINEKKRVQLFFKISWLCLKNISIISFFGFIRTVLFYTFKKR